MGQSRRSLYARISPESHAGWSGFCAAEGMTVTAAVEAIGLALGEPKGIPARMLTEIVMVGRQVAAERRGRRRDI
jgi:hypothetical protein